MAAKSSQVWDTYKWVANVIKSCVNIEQLETSRRLIRNFENKVNRDLAFIDNSHLTEVLWEKYVKKQTVLRKAL